MTGRRTAALALAFVFAPAAAALVAGCAGDDPAAPACALREGRGPALGASTPYLLVAGSLSEEWGAIALRPEGASMIPERGLVGRAPNDIAVQGERLLVVNSLDNELQIVDLTTGVSIGCVPLGAGANPWDVELDPAAPDRAWVTTWLSGELLEVDLTAGRVVRRRELAPGAEGLLVETERITVTLTAFQGPEGVYGQGEVVTLDKTTLAERSRVAVPTNPQHVLRAADGTLHVTCTGNYGNPPPARRGRIVRIEPDGGTVRDTLELGGAPVRAVLAANGVVYLPSFGGGILAYDPVGFTVVRGAANPIAPELSFAAAAAHGDRLYAASFEDDAMVAVDLDGGEIVDALLLGLDGPIALAVRPASP